MKPVIFRGLRVVGFAARTTVATERDPEQSQLGKLWFRLVDGGSYSWIRSRVDRGEYIEVHTDYDASHEEFTLLVGQRVIDIYDIPEGMTAVEATEGRYLKFTARGDHDEVDDRLRDKVERYFRTNDRYERAYAVDFTFPGQGFDRAAAFISIK